MTHDAIVIGAGAAGLFYAGIAGRRGMRVIVLDHAKKPAEKVRISGGGRCNFTNIHTAPDRFISNNPHFARSALSRYAPNDFLDLLRTHHITWHEKTLGQLFCDGRSDAIIQMLLDELAAGGGELRLSTPVGEVRAVDGGWEVSTPDGALTAPKLVIATGGLSIPKMGATGFAYELAERFGHTLVEPTAGLVPFTFEGADKADFASISGVAAPVVAQAGRSRFEEAMLFTHRGLSGPAMLQISSYWKPGEPIAIDLFTGTGGADRLKALKAEHPMKSLASAMEALLPRRLVELLRARGDIPDIPRLADASHKALDGVAAALSDWRLRPAGTEGWRTAEVTLGGIDTRGLSQKTMESRHAPGLHFIGECVDVTGWLGGYNFQWAWASAFAAAQAD
ncbi:NAD(P)/FAD-dependent oxidoreductase [Glycocaulis profundi]|nr:NAD(P)/FAD-dependent oxidoreductase [Glycocaulis profundi]